LHSITSLIFRVGAVVAVLIKLKRRIIISHWKCHKKGGQNFFIKVDKKKFVAQYYH